MAIDVRKHKKKISDNKPNINLVPLIDILFTIMIFLVVTSSFSEDVQTADTSEDVDGGGKPNVTSVSGRTLNAIIIALETLANVTSVSGSEEYYVVPVANLHKVTVNGVDRSDTILNSAVGVQAEVMDKGQITIKPGEIDIVVPAGFSPEKAVQRPQL